MYHLSRLPATGTIQFLDARSDAALLATAPRTLSNTAAPSLLRATCSPVTSTEAMARVRHNSRTGGRHTREGNPRSSSPGTGRVFIRRFIEEFDVSSLRRVVGEVAKYRLEVRELTDRERRSIPGFVRRVTS